jgi:catechol-2,3-dioxygenase
MFAKIRHVALYSENYERMSTFYQKAFGMKKITNGSTNPDRGHISDGVIGLAILGRRPGMNAGFDHFGFEVEDTELFLERLRGKYPKLLFTKGLERVPFAVYRAHDPAGTQFDISQKGNVKVRDGYTEDGWDQPRWINHLVIQAAEPESVARFYQEVLELAPLEGQWGAGNFCLTDGKVRMLVRPTNDHSYTSMKQGLHHVGFKVESLEQAKKDLDELAAAVPASAPRKIDTGLFGHITQREMESCPMGRHCFADPDGDLLDISDA